MGTERLLIIPEPELEFRHGQNSVDPKAGLTLFGPVDREGPGFIGRIPYGVIGPEAAIIDFKKFSSVFNYPIIPENYTNPRTKSQNLLWPSYPGFEAIFGIPWSEDPVASGSISDRQLSELLKNPDTHLRVNSVVNLYLEKIKELTERDERLGVLICVVPDEVWKLCRTESRLDSTFGKSPSKRELRIRREQRDIFGDWEPEDYEMSADFRRQLKAKAMTHGVPLQIIKQSTLNTDDRLSNEIGISSLHDRAWNLSTAIYYKAGGKPWRLSTAREGVCYIGLAFRRDPHAGDRDSPTACCAAQMFLDSGDGIVFRGEFGPWYSVDANEYHLSADEARKLLAGVLEAYEKQHGQALSEVFLHCNSALNNEEWEGYKAACPSGVKLVGVRVRQERGGFKLFRTGRYVVQRGTLWIKDERTAYLWASGFKSGLLSYDGSELPIPLRIDIQHGVADIEQVARDILSLTKLNYNACKYGDAAPVTVGFSQRVGEILIANKNVTRGKPNFKFYI